MFIWVTEDGYCETTFIKRLKRKCAMSINSGTMNTVLFTTSFVFMLDISGKNESPSMIALPFFACKK